MKKILAAAASVYPVKPIAFVDIGARWGVQRPWNNFPETHLNYFGFDADVEECKRLNAANTHGATVVYLPAVILDKESEETLYVTQEEGCSSVYRPNPGILNRYYFKDNWNVKKEIRLTATTLYNVFKKNSIVPEFMKIDTQGSELRILMGAGSCLDTVLGLELEVEFLEAYQGQPLFADVDNFVRDKGFELFDLNRYWASRSGIGKYHVSRGQVVFGDAIYFRSQSSFYSQEMTVEQRKEKLVKMVLILSLYGFFDVAVDYINDLASPLNGEEKTVLITALSDISEYSVCRKLLCDNKIAGKFGRLFKLLGDFFSFPLNTIGWGTDYNGIDGRFPYFRKEGRHFKKI